MADHAQKPTNPRAPSGRPLLWIMAGLVLAAAVALVLLLSRAGEKAAPRPSAEILEAHVGAVAAGSGVISPSEKTPRRTEPPPSSPPSAPSALPTLDLFTSDAPELISRAREVTNREVPLSGARLKELYQFGKDHPGDARPHLLMGADSMNRQWYGFAVDHYVRAQKEDPRARQDSRMLQDLAHIAGDEHYASRAGDALRDIYGPSAMTAVEDAIAEAGAKGDMARVERLTACASSLSAPAPPR
jgi:hypothetical protein